MSKTKSGGAREGAGRHPIAGTRPKMKSVKLSLEHWDCARQIGDGVMTEGIRRALDAYYDKRNPSANYDIAPRQHKLAEGIQRALDEYNSD